VATVIDQTIIDTAREYLRILRENNVQFESAWLFGSCARNQFDEDSDIDIALVMRDVAVKFFKEVELMKYRRRVDSRIEPHVIPADELDSPFAQEIMLKGMRID